MDGIPSDDRYFQERRKRLAAERTLERTRTELSRAYTALVANADRLSLRYLSEREENVRLTDRQAAILEQRKEAAEKADRARRRLWHALETMRDGFALFDAENRLIAANSVYLRLFDAESEIGPGASAEQMFRVAGEEGAFAFDEEPDEWVAAQMDRWSAEEIAPQTLRTFDDRVIRFQDRRAPDGDLVSLAIDLSEEHAREENLARARDAAEETAEAKQAFLARMSHEMRTPMNGVLGLAEMLADRDIDAESKTYARTIRDSAEALLAIVGDTLDVSRLEADRAEMRVEAFDLETLLIDCIRLARASRRDGVPIVLDYQLDAPVQVSGDAGRVRQIMMNLIGNAAKFTDTGHVLVRARLSRAEGGVTARIEVRDTGPGIPEAERESIFEAFAQVEGERPQREGTGLGLTISRGLAEKAGGSLIADAPEDGAGSLFRLTLPFGAAQDWPDRPELPSVLVPAGTGIQGDVLAAALTAIGAEVVREGRAAVALVTGAAAAPGDGPAVLIGDAAHVPPEMRDRIVEALDLPLVGADLLAAILAAAESGRRSPRILIVDDNATNRFLLERMLEPLPYELDTAEDGLLAVAAYRARRPDLLLMDISMPGMDGFEALAAIQALEAERGGQAPPVIALTAHVGGGIEARLAGAGFVAHQRKPVRKAELLEAMEAALAG